MVVLAKTLETLRDDVPVRDIFLDDLYGRPLNAPALQRLVDRWDRGRVGVIYLSLRPFGGFACLDGWHRVSACRAVEGPLATLPARIYIDLSPHDEAELFAAFNRDRTVPKPGEIFRARLAAGDKAACEIDLLVRSLGLELALDGSAKDGVLLAVATVERVYENYGAAMLREVLLTLRNTLGTHHSAFQGGLLDGLTLFFVRYRDTVDMPRLYSVLSTHGTTQIVQTARAHRAASPRVATASVFGMAILQLYNQGLRTRHLAPWAARAYSEKGRAASSAASRRNLAHARAARNGKNGR